MKPILVSFRLCPFVRRSVILMRLKEMEHDVVYIDLADPPDWFLELSPLKKVPLLRVGDDVLFESGAINEYLDETGGEASLLPADPVEKARHRAWIEFSTRAMWHAFHLTAETTDAGFDKALVKMWDDFDRLENAMSGTRYFDGDDVSLVDVSFAPLFQQLEYLAELNAGIVDAVRHPGINDWSRSLCSHPAIRGTLGDDFVDLYHALIYRRQGVMSRFVDASRFHDQVPGRY